MTVTGWESDPDRVRKMNLWRLYQITLEDYDARRARQDFRCAICLVHEDDILRRAKRHSGRPRKDGKPPVGNPLHVDHDHTTGAVRGLLCGWCNVGLGQFRDEPARLRAAADYLTQSDIPPVENAA